MVKISEAVLARLFTSAVTQRPTRVARPAHGEAGLNRHPLAHRPRFSRCATSVSGRYGPPATGRAQPCATRTPPRSVPDIVQRTGMKPPSDGATRMQAITSPLIRSLAHERV